MSEVFLFIRLPMDRRDIQLGWTNLLYVPDDLRVESSESEMATVTFRETVLSTIYNILKYVDTIK